MKNKIPIINFYKYYYIDPWGDYPDPADFSPIKCPYNDTYATLHEIWCIRLPCLNNLALLSPFLNFYYRKPGIPWKKHPFHLVTIRPWPIICSINAFNLIITLIIWFYLKIYWTLLINFILLVISILIWWRDVIRERTYQGHHTQSIRKILKFRIILFIISEIFFFISFFWTYFHNRLSPSIEIGINWPPKNIIIFNPYKIPLLNSLILITSGITLTWSHYCILNKNYLISKILIFFTILLGILFSSIQYIEYIEAPFSINDRIFSSIFFLLTGFHGLHVLIGIIFLSICFIRILLNHFSNFHHFNFERRAWYWHFVDVIWLLLYIIVYWWNY